VHDAPPQLSPNLITLRSNLKQVYAKGTNIDALQGTSWVEEIQNEFARDYCGEHCEVAELLPGLMVPLASLKPPMNPSWPQAASPAQSPSPFYVVEPRYSPSSCSVIDDDGTPSEPAMPVHV